MRGTTSQCHLYKINIKGKKIKMINILKRIGRQILQRLLSVKNTIKEKIKAVWLKREEKKPGDSPGKQQKQDSHLKFEQEILRLLQEESKGLTFHEMIYGIGIKKKELHKIMSKLIKENKVKRNKGLYFKN